MPEIVSEEATIANHAQNGRSTRSFIRERLWEAVLDRLQPGDWLIMQFGHNDNKDDPARHTDPFTTYAATVPPVLHVDTPTVLSTFAHDTKPAPLAFAARFVNVQRHVEHAEGGHFAAWEQPERYAEDLRTAVALGSAR